MRSKILAVTAAVLALGTTAALWRRFELRVRATTATGPIKVWLSNNPEEIAWGKPMVEAWNASTPTSRSTRRRSRPARAPRRSSAPRSPPATRPA